MAKRIKLIPSDFHQIGFYDTELIKSAGKTAKKLIKDSFGTKEEILEQLQKVFSNPDSFLESDRFHQLAISIKELQEKNEIQKEEIKSFELKTEAPTFAIFGKDFIEKGALNQMQTAMRLPISLAGAVMPDAHLGYGLPIGGVLATTPNTVIPFAVGVDIACRMCLSVFELEAHHLEKNKNKFKNFLQKNTCFGTGKGFQNPLPDDLFDKEEWKTTKVIRDLKQKAVKQIGSSGTGNHFVEWGFLEVLSEDDDLHIPKGVYLALLSHSGSRGFGASIAGHYTKIAMEKSKLPEEAKHLAWLDLNSEEGQEYWIGMNLAGEYASANHHHIHQKMAMDLGLKPLLIVENHHNFAWKDTLEDGKEVIIHRKGATPAKEKEFGIIPGSMTQPGFLVKGKGNTDALFSASHGAGRQLSRRQAHKQLTQEEFNRTLVENEVKLIGGDLDEAPMVYKDIFTVMEGQKDLVEIIGKFIPKIVRMADKEERGFKRKKKGGPSFQET